MAAELVQEDRQPPVDAVESATQDHDSDISPAKMLTLLGDEHTRNVLIAVAEEPRSGLEVAEETAVSEPTAYRRLNELAEAGLVESETVLNADGYHHKQFRAVLDTATFHLDGDTLSVDVTASE